MCGGGRGGISRERRFLAGGAANQAGLNSDSSTDRSPELVLDEAAAEKM